MAVKTNKISSKETPLMKQYNGIKAKYPDALLLFRVGDFYETFGEDAVRASKVLGIVLTKRKNGAAAFIDLAGFPHHSLETYLPKLVRAGFRVAICDQLEDPKQTKTIVKRGVTELITPGVALNDNVLDNKSNNFLAAIHFDRAQLGISFLDISTGEFLISEGDEAYIQKLLEAFKPSEVLHCRSRHDDFDDLSKNAFNSFELEDWIFEPDFAKEKLLDQFQTLSLKGFGISELPNGVIAAGAVLQYLKDTHHTDLNHIRSISRLDENEHVWLDPFTIRNLELIHPLNPNGLSLMSVLDHTSSPMGARLLKRWILLPLKDIQSINDRLDGVSFFASEEDRIADISLKFKQIGDVERIISRVAVKKANPKEILH
ncbi:MAG: DNA mismatch repair protein MutS, partial [Flavobacteriales bacterium]|nr:DNA mismatch repair protein MutS [Flavobacteriales bacterium]